MIGFKELKDLITSREYTRDEYYELIDTVTSKLPPDMRSAEEKVNEYMDYMIGEYGWEFVTEYCSDEFEIEHIRSLCSIEDETDEEITKLRTEALNRIENAR